MVTMVSRLHAAAEDFAKEQGVDFADPMAKVEAIDAVELEQGVAAFKCQLPTQLTLGRCKRVLRFMGREVQGR